MDGSATERKWWGWYLWHTLSLRSFILSTLAITLLYFAINIILFRHDAMKETLINPMLCYDIAMILLCKKERLSYVV